MIFVVTRASQTWSLREVKKEYVCPKTDQLKIEDLLFASCLDQQTCTLARQKRFFTPAFLTWPKEINHSLGFDKLSFKNETSDCHYGETRG